MVGRAPDGPARRRLHSVERTSRPASAALRRAKDRATRRRTPLEEPAPMYLDRFRLPGRIALVTGGAGAIGLAICDALSEAGATVVIADRAGTELEAAAASLRQDGRTIETIGFD